MPSGHRASNRSHSGRSRRAARRNAGSVSGRHSRKCTRLRAIWCRAESNCVLLAPPRSRRWPASCSSPRSARCTRRSFQAVPHHLRAQPRTVSGARATAVGRAGAVSSPWRMNGGVGGKGGPVLESRTELLGGGVAGQRRASAVAFPPYRPHCAQCHSHGQSEAVSHHIEARVALKRLSTASATRFSPVTPTALL